MRFTRITLQDFRNFAFAAVELRGARIFLRGPNAQGKTNFLEAAGYVTALRSFRGADTRALIRHGAARAGLAFEIEHERFGASRIVIALTPQGRDVEWEQGRVARLAEFLGRFPTVIFSSQDNQLLRGSPALRRRWLDLTLAAMDGGYLASLQGYTRSVAERNLLLKQGGRDASAIGAFERTASVHAAAVVAVRERAIHVLGGMFEHRYRALAPGTESASLRYRPESPARTPEEFGAQFLKARARDVLLRTTEHGPHRDDFDMLVDGHSAKQFGSEGQQRTLVIALRLAQAEYFRDRSAVTPVLLCDDVLGELDPWRRRRFWEQLAGEPQVIATGTAPPDDAGEGWQTLLVSGGAIAPAGGAAL